jgi:hypothetical protein
VSGEIGVRSYEPDDRPAWDDLVRRSRSPHFMLTRGYFEYHADRFADASLLVREGGRLLAVLPANRDGDRLVSHGGLTFGGFVSDRRMTATRMLAAFDAVLDRLRADGVATWVYKAVPHIYHRVPAEEDLYALVRCGARLVRRDVSSTILMSDRLPYSKGRKAAVKAARGLQVTQERDFGEFWAVEEEALARRHGVAPVHSLEEISLLAGRFPDEIELFTARDDDGALLGGIVVFVTPVLAHAQYIASTEEGQACGAVDAIVEHLLTDRYADRRWFDFGISTTEQGRVLNEGLVGNKESYGARAIAYDTYELEVA